MKTNIVLLTRDREELYQQTVESLYRETPEAEFDLMIIDDGSQKPVKAPHQARNSMVFRFEESEHNLGDLKSFGVRLSTEVFGRAEVLTLIDNDCFFLPGWLSRMSELISKSEPEGYRLWGGQNHPFHMKRGFSWPGPFNGLIESWTLAGTHMMLRWQTWDKFGPLKSEGPGPCRGEDCQLSRDLRATGAKIGIADPFVALDCGITQTSGTPSPGMDEKVKFLDEHPADAIYN